AADDGGLAVAVDVAGGHAHAARETRVVGEETAQDRAVGTGEDGDVGSAAAVGAADDVGLAVAVDVAGSHVDAAREAGGEGEEVVELRAVAAVPDDDVRPAARPGRRDAAGDAVAVAVAD